VKRTKRVVLLRKEDGDARAKRKRENEVEGKAEIKRRKDREREGENRVLWWNTPSTFLFSLPCVSLHFSTFP